MNITKYEKIMLAAKAMLLTARRKNKLSEKNAKMDTLNSTDHQRARASDRLTDECLQLQRDEDAFHALVVDAGLAMPFEEESYESVEISQGAGLGHIIHPKYTPPKPKCLEG